MDVLTKDGVAYFRECGGLTCPENVLALCDTCEALRAALDEATDHWHTEHERATQATREEIAWKARAKKAEAEVRRLRREVQKLADPHGD